MRILAVDLGMARTGLAVSDASATLASPVGTVFETDMDRLIDLVIQKATDLSVQEIVVGHPRNMDGSLGESAKRAASFAVEMQMRSGFPVRLWDERLTTVSAAAYLNKTNTRGKKRKAVIDTVSATIILQDYLDSLRLQRESLS